MEVGDGGDGKKPPDAWKKPEESSGEKPPKRKMKSPYQLEVLEKTYAEEAYPSEAVRAELSAKIGLSDRQLQMWFCHRRLKDRKFPSAKRLKKEEEPLGSISMQMPAGEMMAPSGSGGGSSSSHFGGSIGSGEPRKVVSRGGAVSRRGLEMVLPGKKYYEGLPVIAQLPPPPPQLSLADMRIVASIEAQLGEPLREDGPVLGVEFDPLPPGAFGAPIVMGQQKHPARSYDSKLFERHDMKPIKTSNLLPSMEHCFIPSSSSAKRKPTVGGVLVHPQVGQRALHEYQFLPEQPSVRSETYERAPQSHIYDCSVDTQSTRVSPLPSGGQFLHGSEQVAPSYTFQGQMSSASLLSQQGRNQILSSGPAEYENSLHSNSYTTASADTQFGIHPAMGLESPYLSSDRRILHEEDASRIERKRKSEEARIAKEVEAHEKRIRKELEKQDVLRRKREEQMRKEMERIDREKRKEEERLMREKQREEERFQREQRRENERREKFLLKENRRAEKMRLKEEMRREKEAARLKAANERATARRIAKEYMELIEDERLELMELAASSKGLPSIMTLDSDTLQHLHMYRDMLSAFPSTSVKLKRPFATQPWIRSEENIGNLLMVWKFLITFADVLELWPFTLDEFVQSLHDYDSRLLGEIHVALLKSIIKDIEDVARTPAFTVGANQNSSANPGGGHPQIVEGAYAWGFDIRCWQRYLNFMTWPEILRQFALSAGFGPQLKKHNVEHIYVQDDNEGNDGEDVIGTLRNGAAAENAVALMQEKGYTRRRRSRHRLTPGTVKFAAFHVLSLEGSRGLTILEVADKIQKSGLRDLTTSKTPEASIAAALSRDTKLFERTAPSTYCVRTPYRKDPADADAILSAAREKIQIFQNVLSDSEEAEKDVEDVDDVDRDDDSECDVADDPEIVDTPNEAKVINKVPSNELKEGKMQSLLVDKKMNAAGDAVAMTPESGFRNVKKGYSLHASENSKDASTSGGPKDQSLYANSNCHGTVYPGQEDTEVDESKCEPWVQGLSEGEYSDLSVEERLHALVALVGVAIEGNSIRIILEERLEAANALKKQMWAEAQLDKRRFKEEYVSKVQSSPFMGYKAETSQTNAAIEGSQTPVHGIDDESHDANLNSVQNEQLLHPQNVENANGLSMERSLLGQEFTTTPDATPLQQYAYAAEKSRAQLKSFIGHRAEEMYVYRSLPLGQDRRRNRYWQFSTSASRNDPGSGRIFFESKDGFWRLIDSEEAFDALVAALDTRGIRESHLHSMLQRIETTYKETIRRRRSCPDLLNPSGGAVKTGATEITSSSDCSTEFGSPSSTLCGLTSDDVEHSSSFRIELGRSEFERNSALKRYQGFLRWMWKECYNSFILSAMKYGKKRNIELLQTCHICYQSYFAQEKHCPSCHKTFKFFQNTEGSFSEHVVQCEEIQKMNPDSKVHVSDPTPMRIRLLKAQLALIEASIPREALQSFWTEGYRKSWGMKLYSSSSAEELFQILTLLENAIKRDCLSSNFETTTELLSSSVPGLAVDCSAALSGSVSVLPWVPITAAAVALRLLDFDASISYMLDQKLEYHKDKDAGEFIKLPSRYAVVKNMQELDPLDAPDLVPFGNEGRWLDSGIGRRGRGRGGRGRGRGRGRGGRGQRGIVSSSRSELKGTIVGNLGKTTRKYTRRGRTRGRGRRRGRRSVRPRQRSESRVSIAKETALDTFNHVDDGIKVDSAEESARSSGGEEWTLEHRRTGYVEADENSLGSESDDQVQASEDEYDEQGTDYARGFEECKPLGLMDSEEDDVFFLDEDGNVDGDEDLEEDDVDPDGNEGMDVDEDEFGNEDEIGGGGGNGDDDEAASSFSSEYSD